MREGGCRLQVRSRLWAVSLAFGVFRAYAFSGDTWRAVMGGGDHCGGRAVYAVRLVPNCLCVFPAGAGSRQDARLAPLGLPSGKRQAATAARSALRDCPVEEGGDAVQRDIAGKEGFADAPGEQERKL